MNSELLRQVLLKDFKGKQRFLPNHFVQSPISLFLVTELLLQYICTFYLADTALPQSLSSIPFF